MIKTILLSTILAAALGTSAALAQDRTITFWGHTYDVPNAQPEQTFVATAPAVPMREQAVHLNMRHHRKHPIAGQ